MSNNNQPLGEERRVESLGGAAIDGAPIGYIVVLAAVCTALSFVPFSVIMGGGGGGSFPLSQGIFPLVGYVLGPIAGAVASGMGALVGNFVAPQTSGNLLVRVLGAVLASVCAGLMRADDRRRFWVLPAIGFAALCLALLIGQTVLVYGVDSTVMLAATLIDWSALLLFALPTRTLIGRWLTSHNVGLLALGLFLGTWSAAGIAHLAQTTLMYFITYWPAEVWGSLIPMAPLEHLVRSLVGAVIGINVIIGLRAIGVVKPKEAVY